MKSHGRRQSDDLEVECLGTVANLSSPEGAAVSKCLDEVTALSKAAIGEPKSINELRDRQTIFSSAISSFKFHQKVQRMKLQDSGQTEGELDLGDTLEAFKQELPSLLEGSEKNLRAQKEREAAKANESK